MPLVSTEKQHFSSVPTYLSGYLEIQIDVYRLYRKLIQEGISKIAGDITLSERRRRRNPDL